MIVRRTALLVGLVAMFVDYTEICRQDLADRRAWTITLSAAGALVLVVAGALSVRARQAHAPQS